MDGNRSTRCTQLKKTGLNAINQHGDTVAIKEIAMEQEYSQNPPDGHTEFVHPEAEDLQ